MSVNENLPPGYAERLEEDLDPDEIRLANCPGCGVLLTGNLAFIRDHRCADGF